MVAAADGAAPTLPLIAARARGASEAKAELATTPYGTATHAASRSNSDDGPDAVAEAPAWPAPP
jgi:hypothetical protein